MKRHVPCASIDQKIRISSFNVISSGVIVAIIRIIPSAKEAFEWFFSTLVIVIHIGATTTTTRDSTTGPLSVFNVLNDRSDEATHGCAIFIVKIERVWCESVAKLDRCRIVLRVFGILLVQFLTLWVKYHSFLRLRKERCTCEGLAETLCKG